MFIREATLRDISAMHIVRMSVKENVLSNPGLVKESDYEDYILKKGKGWVCEVEGRVVGFAIVDVFNKEVWALFVAPAFEGKGVGKQLHDIMLQWYFRGTCYHLQLGTEPGTRAETFYLKNGWKQTGRKSNGELLFRMTRDHFNQQQATAGQPL